MRNRLSLAIVFAALVATGSLAQAQQQGTCLAVTNNLNEPILFTLDSTDGSSTNMAMTAFAMSGVGHEFTPWVVPPGGPQMLAYRRSASEMNYVVTSNGNFSASALPIDPPTSSQVSFSPGSALIMGHWVKISWAFHAEMTEGGVCNGTEVAIADSQTR